MESRCLLSAASGLLWDNAAALTVSFAPDGTDVSGKPSELFSAMSSLGEPGVWQRAIFDAIQTWAVPSNINIGVVDDGGQPLGCVGRSQGDTRFGDIRIAGAAMAPDVLAISIPADGMIAGTWSGDIVFNTSAPVANLDDLNAIALHEVGHVLGLEENSDPASPLYSHLTPGAHATPTAGDLAALKNLYGARVSDWGDRGRSNETLKTATAVRLPDGYNGSTPLIVYGDLTRTSDVDYYVLPSLPGDIGPRTVQLRTSGVSLLNARISVVDSRGVVLGRAASSGTTGQTASITLDPISPSAKYYLRIESESAGMYGVGTYAIVVTFDGRLTTDSAVIDSMTPRNSSEISITQFPGRLISEGTPDRGDRAAESDSDSDHEEAIELKPSNADRANPRYDATGAVTTATPFSLFRIKAPENSDGQASVLMISVRANESDGLIPSVALFDENGEVVPVQVIANGLGVYTIQATEMSPGSEYTARVGSLTDVSPLDTGRFSFVARFGSQAIQIEPLASGRLSADLASRDFQLDVSQSQLFQFVLAASPVASPQGVAVQFTIFDSNGHERYRLSALPSEARTASAVLLSQGSYLVRVSALALDGAQIPAMEFTIKGRGLSDPIGPILSNPTGTLPSGALPGPRQPQYTWTSTVTITPPIVNRPTPRPAVPPGQAFLTWYWYGGIPLP